MRLLLINQFYPPDVAPTGQFLHDVARELVGRGHAVRILCSRRPYDGGPAVAPAREALDGVDVVRVAASGWGRRVPLGRALDYASFALSAGARLAAGARPDLVVSLTTPPAIGTLAALTGMLRDVPHACWLMDLYPEALVASGALRAGGVPGRLLGALAGFERRRARAVLALGPRPARRLGTEGGEWCYLWGPEPTGEAQAAAERGVRGWGDELVLLYAGNLGLGHRIEEFLEAAGRLGRGGQRWVFAGGGARRGAVERFAREHPVARVELAAPVPRAGLSRLLQAADVHLASLADPWQGVIVPSKVIASFCVGRPVIFVGSADNEVADWLDASGGGWRVPPGDVDALLRAVAAATSADERRARGAAARRFAVEHFDRARNTARVADVLEAAAHRPAR